MKINWKSKKTRFYAILLLVILVPIIYNQISSAITGAMTAYMMSQPKEVVVAHPEARVIHPILDELTGRVEAQYAVDIVSRINGWLEKRYFVEGDRVKKGQLLFLIQPEEYQNTLQNATAAVNDARAVYKNSIINYDRAKALLKEDLVSKEYYDNMLTERNRGRATLDGAIAQLQNAELNLSYTKIKSPIDGRIGNVKITEGNYLTVGSGVIAQVYNTNPMKVVFSEKSSTFLKLKKLYYEGKALKVSGANPDQPPVSVLLKLADGTEYEYEGEVSFVDNKIDEGTGTVTLNAIFENPLELLVPGDYVNVKLRVNKDEKVMLIPQSATKSNISTGYYVWVEKDGKAIKKDIKVSKNIDSNWIVEEGLDYSDNVIVEGIQDIYQTGQKVKVIPASKKIKVNNPDDGDANEVSGNSKNEDVENADNSDDSEKAEKSKKSEKPRLSLFKKLKNKLSQLIKNFMNKE